MTSSFGADMDSDLFSSNVAESSPGLTCVCGRAFFQPGALKTHQRSCSKRKKWLAGALDKAKELWMSRKRACIENSGGGDGIGEDSDRDIQPNPPVIDLEAIEVGRLPYLNF